MLEALDRMERRGETAAQVGKALGFSRSAVCGFVKRVRDDLADSEVGSQVLRPDNQDGALGPMWWARGIARRGVAPRKRGRA